MELSIYVVKVRVRETGVRQRRVLPQGAAVLLPPSMLSSLPVGVRALYCVKFLSVVPCILSIFAYLNCLFIYSLKFLCAILWCHFLRRLLLHCLQIRHRPTRASRLRCRSSSQVILAARVLTQVSPLPPSSALGCCCCWYLTWLPPPFTVQVVPTSLPISESLMCSKRTLIVFFNTLLSVCYFLLVFVSVCNWLSVLFMS